MANLTSFEDKLLNQLNIDKKDLEAIFDKYDIKYDNLVQAWNELEIIIQKHQFEIPNYLYRFCSIDRLIGIFKENQIFIQTPALQNDIYDFLPNFNYWIEKSDIENLLVYMFRQDILELPNNIEDKKDLTFNLIQQQLDTMKNVLITFNEMVSKNGTLFCIKNAEHGECKKSESSSNL